MATVLKVSRSQTPRLESNDPKVKAFVAGLQDVKGECISRFRHKRGKSAIRIGKPTLRYAKNSRGEWVWKRLK
jgi:hypothetical protein